MAGCEGVLDSLIEGISEAEQLKSDLDNADEQLDSDLGKLPFAAGPMAASCAIAAFTRNKLSISACAVHTGRTLHRLNEVARSLNDYIAKKQAFNRQAEKNHDLFNKFCYCLSLGVEAIEYGTEFDELEAQLEALQDEADEATNDEELEAIEEEIEGVLEDLQFFDELLDELREEIEQEFG